MQSKLAIDIVLLLPDEINKIVCDLSSKIIPVEGLKPYVLDNFNYFPHISLLMGTIDEGHIESIKSKIEPIFKKYFPLEIIFTRLEPTESKFPHLVIKKTQKLINLQNEVAGAIYLDYDATKKMCVDSDISDLGIDWINNFRKNNLGEGKFNLHVTLGLGDASSLEVNLPIKTVINSMAICHIGYGCSCKKILAKVTP